METYTVIDTIPDLGRAGMHCNKKKIEETLQDFMISNNYYCLINVEYFGSSIKSLGVQFRRAVSDLNLPIRVHMRKGNLYLAKVV